MRKVGINKATRERSEVTIAARKTRPKRETPVRLSMDMPPDLHLDLKRRVVDEETTITQYVTELLRRDLRGEAAQQEVATT